MENRKSKKPVLGIGLLLLGAILFLRNFGIVDAEVLKYLFAWQSVVIFLGIFAIAVKPQRMTGYLLLTLGVVFWLPEIFGINAGLIVWPAILIGVGMFVLLKGWFLQKHPQLKHQFVHCHNKHKIRVESREN